MPWWVWLIIAWLGSCIATAIGFSIWQQYLRDKLSKLE